MAKAVLLLMIYLTSCGSLDTSNSLHQPSKQSLANQVTNETFTKLKEEKELYPFGVGSGMMNQIKMLALSFCYYKEVEIEQARELLIAAATSFLNTINNNEQIRSHLENYPFKPENIEIRIFLQKPNGSEPDLDKLTVVAVINGILEYDIRSSETKRLTTIHREKFEEAAAKLDTAVSF